DGASGRIEIESAVNGEWCIDMEAVGLSADVSDSHIHFGPTGNNGDVVIPIGAPTSVDGDTDTWDDVCVAVEDSLVAEVLDAPDAFYANIHTADFAAGAIRGQLEASTIFDLTLS
ncbi:MAG: CHRD domain-containing protein, partial [Acidimicrobiales bacterium]|nr:CHRD domain-containing protein [Acidimicrobiales bacterium]